jgi:hypothetical protein
MAWLRTTKSYSRIRSRLTRYSARSSGDGGSAVVCDSERAVRRLDLVLGAKPVGGKISLVIGEIPAMPFVVGFVERRMLQRQVRRRLPQLVGPVLKPVVFFLFGFGHGTPRRRGWRDTPQCTPIAPSDQGRIR